MCWTVCRVWWTGVCFDQSSARAPLGHVRSTRAWPAAQKKPTSTVKISFSSLDSLAGSACPSLAIDDASGHARSGAKKYPRADGRSKKKVSGRHFKTWSVGLVEAETFLVWPKLLLNHAWSLKCLTVVCFWYVCGFEILVLSDHSHSHACTRNRAANHSHQHGCGRDNNRPVDSLPCRRTRQCSLLGHHELADMQSIMRSPNVSILCHQHNATKSSQAHHAENTHWSSNSFTITLLNAQFYFWNYYYFHIYTECTKKIMAYIVISLTRNRFHTTRQHAFTKFLLKYC